MGIGVLVTRDFKLGPQCKTNRMLDYINIKISVSSNSSDIILPLYRSLVMPYLEYAVLMCSPYYGILKKDIDLMEIVQHRARKLIQGTCNMID